MRTASYRWLWAVVLTCILPCIAAVTRAADEDGDAAQSQEATAAAIDVRPASFQEVTPGKSDLDDVEAKLGEPVESKSVDGQQILIYQIGPFPQVEVALTENLVDSIVVHLEKPLAAAAAAKQLSLQEFDAVEISDDAGELLGRAYPERGVMLTYATGTTDVAQLILEPISTETFWLRLGARTPGDFSGTFNDIAALLELEEDQAELRWRQAKLLLEVGDFHNAGRALQISLQDAPTDPRYVLLSAELSLVEGQVAEAKSQLENVTGQPPDSPLGAKTRHLLGLAAAAGADADHKQAMEHQLAAIKLATPLASSDDLGYRREAVRILVDAHLDVAESIVRGNWARKPEIVPKWLRTAEELAMSAIDKGYADETLRLRVWRRTLESYRQLDGYRDAQTVFAAARKVGEKLLDAEGDPYREQLARRELLHATFTMIRIKQARDHHTHALELANEAIALLEGLGAVESMSELDQYLVGRLYFYIGAIYAVHHQDHDEAVRWYERAMPLLPDELPPSEQSDLALQAERFVSMGVSYWETGVKNEGVELTQTGLELMQRAVRKKLTAEQDLLVAYNNLAAMLRKTGRDDEAREFAAKAARLEAIRDSEQR